VGEMEDILLFGLGGHAHSVVDSIEEKGDYNVIGFLDTEKMQGKGLRDYRVLGLDDAMQKYFDRGVRNAFITVGFMGHGQVRDRLYRKLKGIGYAIPDIIDPTAAVSQKAQLEEGVFVGKGAVVNANAKIGRMGIINTKAVVEHDCMVGAFSHIAVGAVLCGGVSVGERTLVGANATVIQGKRIGENCIVGAGAVVRKDLPEHTVWYGVEK
jgi:sugar O-acyltransferase, sialic acid O-acetyltransferase NeuD family